MTTTEKTYAQVTTPGEDGFELLWWSPTSGPIAGHPDGRRRLTDGSAVDGLPDDAFSLVPQKRYADLEQTVAAKLHYDAWGELSQVTDLCEMVDVVCRHLPDNSIGAPTE